MSAEPPPSGAPGTAPREADEENLTSRVLGGAAWSVGLRVLGILAQVAYTSVMARLLTPAAFGLVASAQVVLLAGQLAAELGIGRAIVQTDELSPRTVRAGFTSSVLLGAALTAVVLLAAPAVAALFDDPGVEPVTRALSVVLLLNTLGVTADALLVRDLRIREVSLLDLGAFVVGYLVVGIGSAIAGAGVYSLVAAAVAKALLFSVGAIALARHGLRPLFAWREVRGLYAFGSQVSLIGVLEYLTVVAPPTAIGRLLGPAALGQFTQGNRILELPFVNLSQALSDVLFPAVSRIKAERARVSGAYLTAIGVTGALMIPVAAGVAGASDELVRVLLGEQWDRAARILPLLAVYATAQLLTYYAATTCEALGVLRPKLAIQTGSLALLVVGFAVVGADAPLVALVSVLPAVAVTRMLAYWIVMARTLSLGALAQPAALSGPLVTAALVAAALAGIGWAGADRGIAVGVLLPLQVATGAALLAWALFLGPLRPVRADVVRRLEHAGLDDRGPRAALLMRVARVRMEGS